jgi:chemotaxis protein methyltransferase CheR
VIAQDWSDPGFATIAQLIEEQTGLAWSAGRLDGAESGMRRAMERARVKSIAQYAQLIRTDAVARDELIAELTIGETYFFRDPAQFALIRERIMPDLEMHAANRPLRIWSAGCASGEEAYSLGIVLLEHGLGGKATVLGTDIARHRLAAARQGRYSNWSLRGVAPSTTARYFRTEGRTYHLAERVRQMAEFRYLNLAEDHYPSLASGVYAMDLVLCRNVLIYFDRATVARVARRLLASLADPGWLLLGAADPPIAEYVDCEVHVTDAGIVYRRQRSGARGTSRQPPLDERSPAVDTSSSGGELVVSSDAEFDALQQATRDALAGPAREADAPDATAAAPDGSLPDSSEATLAAARAAYADRRYEVAAELAARAKAPGKLEEAWIVRVRAEANRGRLAEASRACLAALEEHRTSAELLYLHAVLLGQAERPRESAAAARQALYLDRSLIVAHIAHADAATALHDESAMRRSLRNAERLLARLPAGEPVPASDGESAGRLLELVRTRLRLLEAA